MRRAATGPLTWDATGPYYLWDWEILPYRWEDDPDLY